MLFRQQKAFAKMRKTTSSFQAIPRDGQLKDLPDPSTFGDEPEEQTKDKEEKTETDVQAGACVGRYNPVYDAVDAKRVYECKMQGGIGDTTIMSAA